MTAASFALPSFALSVEPAGPARVVRVSGPVDLYSAAELRSRLIEQGDWAGHVVADLTEAPFLDSSGAAALLTAGRRLRARGAELVIANPHPATTRLFDVLGLEDLLRVEQTRAAALAPA
jgi:anti-sigma B factor antagonist